jgi:hypothetical protein
MGRRSRRGVGLMVVDDTKVDLNVLAGGKAVSPSLVGANFKPESPVAIQRSVEVPDGEYRRDPVPTTHRDILPKEG